MVNVNCSEWGQSKHKNESFEISLYEWEYYSVGGYVVFATFVLVSGIAKIAFHHAHFLSSRIPESW
jgi:hypothetical protein